MDPSNLCNELYHIARTHPGQSFLHHFSDRRVWIVQNPSDTHQILKANAANWPKHMAWMRQTLGPSRMSENQDAWLFRRQLTQNHFNHYDASKTVRASRQAFSEELPHFIAQTAASPLSDHLLRNMTLRIFLDVFLDTNLHETGIDPEHLFHLLELSAQYAFVPSGGLTSDERRHHVSQLNAAKARVMQDLGVFRRPEYASKPVIQDMLAAETSTRGGPDPFVLEQELITLLAAGSETSASTFGWMCHLLAQHPDLQKTLRNCDYTSHLLDDFLSETMRLFPANPILSRHAVSNDVFSTGKVQPGDVALVSLVGLQMQGVSRDNPWQLDLTASRKLHNRAESGLGTAFGIGERVCGGRLFAITEMRTLLHELLQTTVVQRTANEPLHLSLDMQWCSLMVRRGGHRVRFQSQAFPT
ncbi:cytochrome P450 [Comamonas sp. JUb58]|uniref:cytochrome P450 n=1 Tax=Comamonas sp. JUb58 TaxID=2485114 RepID=UPI00105BEDF5|nr:cytochrome P450 [Comamonas sp. JUb58]TDS69618.1 cytochrome P450 [Comamonas sp. JUb58]